jgi:S-adenosylmethionine-diacylgycerolhomoserine-N-methlytransferase
MPARRARAGTGLRHRPQPGPDRPTLARHAPAWDRHLARNAGFGQGAPGETARLALADASAFDAQGLLGTARFDRIVISFALSMIPPWRETVAHAATLLAPGGSLHMVDFHDAAGLPGPLRRLLQRWLARFHVTPRTDLAAVAQASPRAKAWPARSTTGHWAITG